MNTQASPRNLRISASIMLVATAAVWGAEFNGALTTARMTLHNILSPGRLVLLAISPDRPITGKDKSLNLTDHEISELQNALLQNELQRRQLLIDNARLHNEIQAMKKLEAIRSVAGRDLIRFTGLKAKVLSHSGLPGTLKEAFVAAGKANGLQKSQLVIEDDGIVVDKGTDNGLTAGQKVVRGSAVIGRISRTSQWVGLVQPVTHKEFSAAVQVVKLKAQGASFGAKGLLEGTGDAFCQISGIPYTESVAVGDEVFSADLDGINGPRLYYGRVTHAEFSAGGQWNIQVEPAFHAQDLTDVTVIQKELSPGRTRTPQRHTSSGGRQ